MNVHLKPEATDWTRQGEAQRCQLYFYGALNPRPHYIQRGL
jgi:hypothetical protein